jgi:hypothetical protein
VKSLLAAGALIAAIAATAPAASMSARPAAPAVHKPTATISFGAEVAVKGRYFKPREKLTITLSSTTLAARWTRKATATKTGTFRVSFGQIALSSCNQYTLKVVGTLKSRFTTSHELVPC